MSRFGCTPTLDAAALAAENKKKSSLLLCAIECSVSLPITFHLSSSHYSRIDRSSLQASCAGLLLKGISQ